MTFPRGEIKDPTKSDHFFFVVFVLSDLCVLHTHGGKGGDVSSTARGRYFFAPRQREVRLSPKVKKRWTIVPQRGGRLRFESWKREISPWRRDLSASGPSLAPGASLDCGTRVSKKSCAHALSQKISALHLGGRLWSLKLGGALGGAARWTTRAEASPTPRTR